MTATKSDPKPAKRYVAKPHEWREIRRLVLSGGRCFLDGCRTPATDCHHLVSRAQRGSDVVENLVPLCHEHHMALHDRVHGWEYIGTAIREGLSRDQEEYVIGVKSQAWIDRYYPRRKSV